MLKHQLSLAALVVLALSVFLTRSVVAGPLTSAEVTKIINQVSVVDPHAGERPAAIRDLIKDDLGLETGQKSRSELLFQDNTLTRIAAETFFSFKTGTRDMTLEKGSMLLQVPKGLGGARIHTGAVTAAITGTTIMMEYIPKQYIKVLVLEGSLRVSRNGFLGDSVVLRPGKMLIMKPDAKRIPEPVNVDLAQIVETSSLINFPGTDPLPSMGLIQAAIEEQQKQIAANNLAPTNLVMGRGANVLIAPTTGTTPLAGATITTTSTDPVKIASSSIAPVGNVLPTLGTTVTTTTGTASNLLASTTGTVSSVAPILGTTVTTTTGAVNNLLSSTTGTVTNLLASTTGTVTGVTSDLLGAASTLASTPVTAVDNVLNSATGTVNSVTNTLLSTGSNVTSIPVSSSSQLLSLANSAVTSTGGIATVVPTLTSTTSTLQSTPISTVTSTSTPTTSSTTSTLTSSTTPLLSSGTTTTTTTTTTTAPTTILSSVTSSPTTTLSSVTSSPTTLLSSTSTTQSSTSSTSLLKLGY